MQFSLSNGNLNSLISHSEENKGIIHIWGTDIGIGKSTLCYAAALSKLSAGKKVIFINTKSFFNYKRFQQLKKYYPSYDKYNFLLYNPRTFAQLTDIIMNIEFLILEEFHAFQKTSIGAIIVDGASILRHLELKTDDHNQKSMRVFSTLVASLEHIRLSYNIPIILSNRSVIRIKEHININQPASNAVMQYWAKFHIKLERTEIPKERKIILEYHPNASSLPIKVRATLADSGFI
jgi:hypothetical protein